MALALLCVASFMAVVDTTIASIALPSIRRAMEFSLAARSGCSTRTRWCSAACCCSSVDSATGWDVGAVHCGRDLLGPLQHAPALRHTLAKAQDSTGENRGIDDKCHHLRSRQYGNGDR